MCFVYRRQGLVQTDAMVDACLFDYAGRMREPQRERPTICRYHCDVERERGDHGTTSPSLRWAWHSLPLFHDWARINHEPSGNGLRHSSLERHLSSRFEVLRGMGIMWNEPLLVDWREEEEHLVYPWQSWGHVKRTVDEDDDDNDDAPQRSAAVDPNVE